MHRPKLSFSKCSDLDKSSLLELKKNSFISDQDQSWVAYLIAYAKRASTHLLKEFMIFWHNLLELENMWFTVDIQWVYDFTFLHIPRISIPLPPGSTAACPASAALWPINSLRPVRFHHLGSIIYLLQEFWMFCLGLCHATWWSAICFMFLILPTLN